ncbi:hypothetical protein TNCT_168391 [Trichonephila clavata]|uniref:Uncharacterized protein n=1 Tax=Trichonephila clavata TaxID=2740835 RepID=A0A8X6GR31_TRICU|nr:hypothetical protein TNCT_168391 [Trichonephila clavata]
MGVESRKKIVRIRHVKSRLVLKFRSSGPKKGPSGRRAPKRHETLSERRTSVTISTDDIFKDASPRRVLSSYVLYRPTGPISRTLEPEKKRFSGPRSDRNSKLRSDFHKRPV